MTLAPNQDRREVPNSPTHIASFRGAVPILSQALLATTRITFVSGRYDRNDRVDSPQQLKTPPSLVWDIVFSGVEPRWKFRYALGIYNVLGIREMHPLSYEFRQRTIEAQVGRSFLATLQKTF
jgi:hypothetical protein